MAGQKRVKLACGLTELPVEIYQLADDLEILDLSGNALSSLPDDLPRLHKLRILFCSDNRFTELPPVLGRCPQLTMVGFKANRIAQVSAQSLPPRLRWLTLTDNRIAELPDEIGRCADLQKLMLAGNRLAALPDSLAACHRLELIRLSANALTHLPDWLFALPRLSWLAFAGNPFCAALEAAALAGSQTRLPEIAWSSLQVQEMLGEGASGVIHRARHMAEGGSQPVAVKLFKGAMTSDGLPLSEMAACLLAGQHSHLIPLRGRVSDHPEGAIGFVMALVGHEFRNLAQPPSLASCTRDVYDEDCRFDLAAALRIAAGIASSARHLHAQGIMHGDLYAHNMLHGHAGETMLGDFGAASLYPADHAASTARFQRLEARAFGCLLEELLDRSDAPCGSETVLESLRQLTARCLSPSPAIRPLFAEIDGMLTGALRAMAPAPLQA